MHTDESTALGWRGPQPGAPVAGGDRQLPSASLVFALRSSRTAASIRAEITARKERNAEGRWRIPRAEVLITLADSADTLQHFDRVLAQFEQFCIVTQSVREGVVVDVAIVDAEGRRHVPGTVAA